MPTALSYPGLRCVLEFLDPMKRIHIVSRNHSLRTIEKTIPLNIKDFGISRNRLKLNDCVIKNDTNNELQFKDRREKNFRRTWSSNLNLEETMKKLLDSYLGFRLKIYNFILQANELECCSDYIEQFLPIIDPSSFPLKKLHIAISEPDYLNHPVLTSSKELIVSINGCDGVTQLINQINTNKRVTFETYCFYTKDPVILIRNWMKNGKEIGTSFKFHDYEDNGVMHLLLKELKEFKTESDHHSRVTPILRVPINSFSEIHVSKDSEDYIVMEVVPTTSKRDNDATEDPCSSDRARQSRTPF